MPMHFSLVPTSAALLAALALVPTAARAQAVGPTFKGFIDTDWSSNLNEATVNGTPNSFGGKEFELDVMHQTGRVSFRADLNVFRYDINTANLIEQAYAAIAIRPTTTLTFGIFNAPIGYELVDAPDLAFYSHALVFDYGLPTNVTGLMLTQTLGKFTFNGYVVNGWDIIEDNNQEKTLGFRLGAADLGGGFGGGISGIFGDEGAPGNRRSVLDLDFGYSGMAGLTLGGEVNLGSEAFGDSTSKWTGFTVTAKKAFGNAALAVRYDYFKDDPAFGQSRLGSGKINAQSISIAPQMTFDERLLLRLEGRIDLGSEDVFTDRDGKSTGSQPRVALQAVYSF